MALDGKGSVLRDEILQIGVEDPLKQFFKRSRFEVGKHQQHPLAGAQAHIGLRQRPLVAGKQHPSVLHPNVFNL